MCSSTDCHRSMGQWVRFQTPWGVHRGIVSDVNQRAVLMRVPRNYAPTGLASLNTYDEEDSRRLDVALAQWGGGYGGYGRRWGYPGYGGWYGGWWWWWLAFAYFLKHTASIDGERIDRLHPRTAIVV